jgi:hypothetical protein
VTLLWLLALNVSSAQQAEVRGWTIAYADGRVTTHVLRPRGGMWTPTFPKLTGNGNAKAAAEYLDIRYVAEGEEVVATVSLATRAFRHRVDVAVVRDGDV